MASSEEESKVLCVFQHIVAGGHVKECIMREEYGWSLRLYNFAHEAIIKQFWESIEPDYDGSLTLEPKGIHIRYIRRNGLGNNNRFLS